jgi:hypothetical protein
VGFKGLLIVLVDLCRRINGSEFLSRKYSLNLKGNFSFFKKLKFRESQSRPREKT